MTPEQAGKFVHDWMFSTGTVISAPAMHNLIERLALSKERVAAAEILVESDEMAQRRLEIYKFPQDSIVLVTCSDEEKLSRFISSFTPAEAHGLQDKGCQLLAVPSKTTIEFLKDPDLKELGLMRIPKDLTARAP